MFANKKNIFVLKTNTFARFLTNLRNERRKENLSTDEMYAGIGAFHELWLLLRISQNSCRGYEIFRFIIRLLAGLPRLPVNARQIKNWDLGLDGFTQPIFPHTWDVFVNILVSIDIGLDTFLYLLIDFPWDRIVERESGRKEKWNGEIFNSRVSDRIAPPISKTVPDLLCEQIYPASRDILYLVPSSSFIVFVDFVQTIEQISERGEI